MLKSLHTGSAFILFILSLVLLNSCDTTPQYKNSTLPIEKRVSDLVSRMTLEEKAAQLDMLSAKEIVIDENNFDEEVMKFYIDDMSIGSIHDLYPNSAQSANLIQRHAVENSRLGIPILFIEEGLHGYQGIGSTTFPAQIGNSSTWDTLLMSKIGRVIATEARAHGVHFILGPNLDLAREIRWGRVEETFGEDQYLAARMGVNFIKGMHGDGLSCDNSVAAEPKHFAIHGIPEGGTNSSPVNIGEREARSTHMYAFERAVKEAGVRGIMAAYHDVDGVPSAANHWLLSEVLRDEWGFKGMVVSDLAAVRLLYNKHNTAHNSREAIVSSLSAGLNMQFYDFPYEEFQSGIVEAVKNGELSQSVLDERVADVLRVKFELGLFDNPYIEEGLIAQRHHCDEHRELAKQAAQKSIVMLKNENNSLPFDETKVDRITLIGEQGNLSLLGGYSPAQARGVTLYEALKNRFGDDVIIDFIENQVENNFKSIPNSALSPLSQMGNGVDALYYNNADLEGEPSYSCIDAEISHYWHNLSPVPGVNRDIFSAEWNGVVTAPTTGEYEFRVYGDDRSRLYLNNKLVVDQWDANRHAPTYKVNLRAGEKLPIKVEYAEIDLNAKISAEWRLTCEISEEVFYNRVKSSIAKSNVVILALGEIIDAVGEGKDRQNLNPTERDVRLLKIVEESRKPSATVVMNGRPFVMAEIDEHSDAVLEAWFPGEYGGNAIVDVLFGDVNPSGKLSISIPRSEGQLPAYYSKRRSFKNNYVDGTANALYPFGHGLSYSTFEYSNLELSNQTIQRGENVTVTFTLRNTSDMKGTEVAQLYLHDKVSSVALPYMTLKGFARVELEPGEQTTVSMELTPEHLSLINIDMERVVEAGEFDIFVGSSSIKLPLKSSFNVK